MQAEAEYIANQLAALHADGVPWNEIGVFYTAQFVGEEIAAALQRFQVPFDWLKACWPAGTANTHDAGSIGIAIEPMLRVSTKS